MFLCMALLTASIVCMWIVVNTQYSPCKMNFIEKAVRTLGFFTIIYLIVSAILIYFDFYKSWRALIAVFIIELGVLTYQRLVKKNKIKVVSEFKITKYEIIALLIFMVEALAFINIKAERIALDSDQGAYYAHAMILAESDYHTSLDTNENLVRWGSSDGDKSVLSYMPALKLADDGNYTIHALPTWSSLLALFWNTFGSQHSMVVLTVLYFIAVFSMYYLCLALSGKEINALSGYIVFALEPLVMYIGKAGLSEIAFMSIFVFSIYLCVRSQGDIIYGIIGLSLLCFVHISYVIYLPMIIVLNVYTGIKKRDKKYVLYTFILFTAYFLSLFYNYRVSQVYTMDQYRKILDKFSLSFVQFRLLILALGIIAIIIQVILTCKENKIIDGLINWLSKNYRIIIAFLVAIVVGFTIRHAYFLGFTDEYLMPEGEDWSSWSQRNEYAGTGIKALRHLNIVNICWAAGIIPFFIYLVKSIIEISDDYRKRMVYLFTTYSLLYYTVVQCDVPRNYYCARYFVPIIIPMVIASGVIAIKKEAICKIIIVVILVTNKLFYIPFTIGAPYAGQGKVLTVALDNIEKGQNVVIDKDAGNLIGILAFSMTVLNDNNVYTSLDDISIDNDKTVYYVSSNELDDDEAELIESQSINVQYSMSGGIDGGYPKDIGYYTIPIYIYTYPSSGVK